MIKAIVTKGLFGRFDYELELTGGVTVLTGPNGAGKSTLLSLTRALSVGLSDEFLRTPFSSFYVVTDKTTAGVEKREGTLMYFIGDKEATPSEVASTVGAIGVTGGKSFLSAALVGGDEFMQYIERLRAIPSLIRDAVGRDESKLALLLKLLSERTSFKKPVATKNDGLVFYDENTGERLPFERLSSGEIALVAFYYELLFGMSDGGLILIDEPETSLHIAWQFTLIDDLYAILELKRGAQAIVSTHSPQVLSKYVDLQVDLGEQYGG